jgi:hypothetical protein
MCTLTSSGEAAMTEFAVIEVEDGLTVVELPPGENPEVTAANHGGTLVDPGPFATYEDACDAMIELKYEDEELES